MTQDIATAPELKLEPSEIDDLLTELRGYHAIYSSLFRRREQREWGEKYLRGLVSDIPRKSIEPIGLALEGANPNAVRALQQFISVGAWEDEVIEVSADEALRAADGNGDAGSGATRLDEAKEWLRERLANGPVPVRDLREQCEADGISWSTGTRARRAIG